MMAIGANKATKNVIDYVTHPKVFLTLFFSRVCPEFFFSSSKKPTQAKKEEEKD
jgi:hypothetical protein